MKLSISFIPTYTLLLFFCLEEIKTLFLKNDKDVILHNKQHQYKFDINFTMPAGPIFAKGWLKYASYEISEKSRPREFYKNFAFYEQFKNSETLNLNSKDNVGYVNVPDEDHFFFVLTGTSLNVLSSRRNKYAKTIDVLNINEILFQKPSCEFEGGIIDHGDFLEGYCFRINAYNSKKDTNNIWEICADTKEAKIFWMNVLARLKLPNNTVEKTVSKIIEERNVKKIMESMKKAVTKTKFIENKNLTWIAIAPWSECTRKCGGGKSYLQRLCILPKNYTGNEKCEGDRILIKDCNLQPCSHSSLLNENLTNSNHVAHSTSPIFKMVPVSNRPLRYEKCVIKDGDMALLISDGNLKGAKIPVRVVLNNRTLTIYSNDNYESIIVSHRLSTITGLRKFKEKTCFEIEESKKKTVLCAFVSNGKNLIDLALEWQKDILEFIRKCGTSYYHELDYKEMTELSSEKVENTMEFYQEKEKDEMEKIIFKTQELALKAVEKELKVEELIEKEEITRQKEHEEGLEKKFSEIQNKDKLIDKALKAKKKQAALYRHQLEIKKKIAKIQEEVIKNIKKKREELRNKLLAMRRDSKRKERLAKLKMDKLRSQITKKLIDASKKGNLQLCDPERPSNDIVQYCQTNYKDSYVKMNECVKNDNFCYMCCETEYGELHLEDRSICYMKCDDFYINKIKFAKKANGKGSGSRGGSGNGKENTICLNVDVSPSFDRTPIIKEIHENADNKLKINENIDKTVHKHHFNFIGGRLNENEILITKFLQSKEKPKLTKSPNNIPMNNSTYEEKKDLKENKKEKTLDDISKVLGNSDESIDQQQTQDKIINQKEKILDDISEVLGNPVNSVEEQKKQLLLSIKNELSDIII